MPDDREPSALQKGAEAVGNVRSAAKAGKAIAAAAKGAAAGGPLGAAVAGVAANPSGALKVGAALIAVFLLPLLFILMLPGLLFGGLTEAFPADSTTAPILNNSTAIVENVNAIATTVNALLAEGLDDVEERIAVDFRRAHADEMEIVNPYESDPYCNINIIIGQYCAARSSSFEQISMQDLTDTLAPAIPHLYTFTKKLESREETTTRVETDPETGQQHEVVVVIIKIWAVYTIQFTGEEYICDQIFALDDEGKTLANNYAQNMSLFLGDGMFQGLLPGEFVIGPSYDGVTLTEGGRTVVYYNQLDERFALKPYGTDTIGECGCGPTAMAIVVSTMTTETIDPINMSAWAYNSGYWCKGSGSYHTLIPGAAAHWSLPCEGASPADAQKIADALSEGKLVVALMSKGAFTQGGHYIVLRAITSDGKILVADPASYKRSQKAWDFSIILNEASRRAGAGGPFWIIG